MRLAAALTEAALVEFELHGYAGTNMSMIARNAGVSTKTLYRLIPTKAEVFKIIIIDRISQFNLALDQTAFAKLDILEGAGYQVDEALNGLEAIFGVPVLDSIAVTLWACLIATGSDPRQIQGWGSLFSNSLKATRD